MTKENDFTLQELELIATQMPLISKNSDLMQKIRAKIKDMTPRTIRIGEFDVPEPLREVPSDGTPLFLWILPLLLVPQIGHGIHVQWTKVCCIGDYFTQQ